jgi:hypothetical protein
MQCKKVAILQSNYIPWKGYFDLIASVDEFILYDDMQYTRRDWRNRNQIKSPQGVQWLTIPVQVKAKYDQKIRDTAIDGCGWTKLHWKTLEQNYKHAAHFNDVAQWLNRKFITSVCDYLNIKTRISNSWDYALTNGKTERLADLCKQAGGTEYISGPSAKDYIVESVFSDMNIKLTWMDYSGYPEYPQLWGGFTHGVTVLDLLFNCGKNAHQFMKYARP